jgi:hypothetical protein
MLVQRCKPLIGLHWELGLMGLGVKKAGMARTGLGKLHARWLEPEILTPQSSVSSLSTALVPILKSSV